MIYNAWLCILMVLNVMPGTYDADWKTAVGMFFVVLTFIINNTEVPDGIEEKR